MLCSEGYFHICNVHIYKLAYKYLSCPPFLFGYPDRACVPAHSSAGPCVLCPLVAGAATNWTCICGTVPLGLTFARFADVALCSLDGSLRPRKHTQSPFAPLNVSTILLIREF